MYGVRYGQAIKNAWTLVTYSVSSIITAAISFAELKQSIPPCRAGTKSLIIFCRNCGEDKSIRIGTADSFFRVITTTIPLTILKSQSPTEYTTGKRIMIFLWNRVTTD